MEHKNFELKKDNSAAFQKQLNEKAFSRFFISSLITMLVAISALCSTTFAWYTASLSTSSTLTAACFDITVAIEDSGLTVPSEDDGSYILSAGQSYTVTLERSSIATAENGYAEIILGVTSYITEQINDGSIVFTIEPASNVNAFFIPHIGTSNAPDKISNGDVLISNS